MTKQESSIKIIFGIAGVFVGCCWNALFLEYLVKADPAVGTLATFCQYVFIALEGFIVTSKFGTATRHLPLKSYITVVTLFLIANVANNYVFKFNISMPLHMIFRSGSLITNMAMGIIILKRNYPLLKFLSVGLITLGVLICTLMTGKEMKGDTSTAAGADDGFFWWMVGITILVIALFVSSLLGIYQEKLYKTYGKYPNEALFFTHLLPIPAFLLFHENIIQHWDIALKSEMLEVPIFKIAAPSVILYLLGNTLTQYLCIKSVYFLSSEASALSVTLVITLRKFVSLLLSIWYFNNNFTFYHWIGTLCVFIGTAFFTEIPQKLLQTEHKVKTS